MTPELTGLFNYPFGGQNRRGEQNLLKKGLLQMNSMRCFKHIEHGTKNSPYTRVIAIGWYDGPEFGAVYCSICQNGHRFTRVDADRAVTMEVHALAGLPEGAYEALDLASTRPGDEWKAILHSAGEDAFVAVTALQLTDRILAARTVTPDELATVADWFAFFGVVPPPEIID